MKDYRRRIVDDELALRLEAFGAVQIKGPKWCGKTTTAMEHSKSYIKLQDPDRRAGYLATARTKPSLLLKGDTPRLIDDGKMLQFFGMQCVWLLMKEGLKGSLY